MTNETVLISISLENQIFSVGKLWCHQRKGRESASFEYDQKWLENPERFALEPALQLTKGTFHTKEGRSLFGAIGDSAPDRWGRILMRRLEYINAKKEKRISKTLFEKDYLLGVNDTARQGALRFSYENNRNIFLSPKSKTAIPPLLSLPKLLSATEHFIEKNDTEDDLKLLLAPGSSLGGARPKASIYDQDGDLAIAKFPRKDDEFNIVIWETVALTLAKQAGIQTSKWQIQNILEKPVLILKRFDRLNENKTRIPFLSAMSMLDAKDNETHSYLEIAYTLMQHSSNLKQDLEELWRRIIFTIMISNTDDHLRNHGFLYERNKGWTLSPLYDVNPTPIEVKPHILTTAIDFENHEASIEIALEIISEFRISYIRAKEIISEVKNAVKNWREIASQFGIHKNECNRMASAFRI